MRQRKTNLRPATGNQDQLPPGSRVVETGGYKGRSRELPKNQLHALITARLAIAPDQIISEYGMSELSSQAYARATGESRITRPLRHSLSPGERAGVRASDESRMITRRQADNATSHSSHFLFPPWARAQIISPETGREVSEGETGLIRVFDLARQCQRESSRSAGDFIETNVTAVLAGQSPSGRQTQSSSPAGRPAGVERIEQMLTLGGSRRGSVILDHKFQTIRRRTKPIRPPWTRPTSSAMASA